MGKAKTLPKVFTEAEQRAIVNAPNRRYPSGRRDRAMLLTMFSSGIRVSECCAIRNGDIDWVSGRFHLKNGKGAKDRVLALPPELLAELDSYRQRKPQGPGGYDGLLFETTTGAAVSPQHMWRMIRRQAVRAGLDGKRVHPHMTRHTWGTNEAAAGTPLQSIQTALGHTTRAMTLKYIDSGGADVSFMAERELIR